MARTLDRITAWMLIGLFALFACLHVLIARERAAAEAAQAEAARLHYEAIAGVVRARVLLMNAEAAAIRAAAWERKR
jgi:preprotein translocase subunit SecG